MGNDLVGTRFGLLALLIVISKPLTSSPAGDARCPEVFPACVVKRRSAPCGYHFGWMRQKMNTVPLQELPASIPRDEWVSAPTLSNLFENVFPGDVRRARETQVNSLRLFVTSARPAKPILMRLSDETRQY